MISLRLTPDTRRKKQDNSYPLVFTIRCKGEARNIKTGYSVTDTHWNSKTHFIKDTHPEYKVIAPRITELKLEYMGKLLQYEKVNPQANVQEVKEFLLSKPKPEATVYSFWEEEITQLYKANRSGGAQVYKEALIAINKVKSLNVPFQKVDYNFLRTVETEFLNRGVKVNTVGVHYRELRAIYNKAIKAKIVSFEYYPFRDYKIKKEKTRPRTVTLTDMQNYFALDLDKKSYMYDSWLLGQLMFMLIGINFKDLIMLTDVDVKADRVFYKRAKTKKLYSIKLLPRAEEIINYFKSKNASTLFGVITPEDINNREKFTLIIRLRNKLFNAHQAKLGKMIDCKEKLTGYVHRYTWANIAKQLGFSKDLIAESLGHEYGNRVTGIYLEAYDMELVDNLNEQIYKAVVG